MRIFLKVAFYALILFGFQNSVYADNYNFYFAQSAEDDDSDGVPNSSAQTVKIINTSTYTVYDGNLSGYYALEYDDLAATITNGVTGSSYSASLDYMGSGKEVLDFAGSTLTVRENSVLQMNDDNVSGDSFTYDRVTKVDVSDGSVTSQILVASSQAAYDYANEAGYTVMLAESAIDRSGGGYQTLTTFSSNVTNSVTATANVLSKGGFSTEQITNADGTVLFREESDGTVHIGENSIVLADEAVSTSGNDEVYSSSGTLQLGNNDNHVTTIRGSLRVADPSIATDAANKRYVDQQNSADRDYADGIGASALASLSSLTSIPNGNGIGIGTSVINGESAIALGLQHMVNKRVAVNLTSSYNSTIDNYTISGGIGWGW